MDLEKWNKLIFDNICIVNRCLYKGVPPSQCGLCSGDSLSENSPFKVESQLVADRLLNLLNLKAFIKSTDLQGNMLSPSSWAQILMALTPSTFSYSRKTTNNQRKNPSGIPVLSNTNNSKTN